MKLIFTNSITSVSSSTGALSSDYAIAKVQNNYPKQPYIANATSATVTVDSTGTLIVRSVEIADLETEMDLHLP